MIGGAVRETHTLNTIIIRVKMSQPKREKKVTFTLDFFSYISTCKQFPCHEGGCHLFYPCHFLRMSVKLYH